MFLVSLLSSLCVMPRFKFMSLILTIAETRVEHEVKDGNYFGSQQQPTPTINLGDRLAWT